MTIDNFIRFSEVIKLRTDSRVASVTITPTITDCTGSVYFTDLQFQEGDKLTGYAQNTATMLGGANVTRWHNGVVRSGTTVIVFNTPYSGSVVDLTAPPATSAGLDVTISPKQAMAAGAIEVSQGEGSHKCAFTAAANADDEFALKASTRECLKNGSATGKRGFFQYSAAYDSKHVVKLESKKSANVLFEYTTMIESGVMQ